jgi:hypothetical protein
MTPVNDAIWTALIAMGAASLIVLLTCRGYYRAAYRDRYDKGRLDEREAQARAHPAADWRETIWRGPVPAWADRQLPAGWYDDHLDDRPPVALDHEPPTSEWAAGLIADVETWNAEHLPAA